LGENQKLEKKIPQKGSVGPFGAAKNPDRLSRKRKKKTKKKRHSWGSRNKIEKKSPGLYQK